MTEGQSQPTEYYAPARCADVAASSGQARGAPAAPPFDPPGTAAAGGGAAPALDRLVTVRVAQAEAVAWRREAAAAGVPLSDLIRARMACADVPATFTGRVRSRRGAAAVKAPALPAEWLGELGRFGSNVNQLARAANEQRRSAGPGAAVGWEALLVLREAVAAMRGIRERVCASCADADAAAEAVGEG